MFDETKRIHVKGQRQAISLSIDTTKCSPVVDIRTVLRAIMGGVFPNYMLRNTTMTKEEIKSILDQTEYASFKIITRSEIKAVFMYFQHSPPGIPPIEVISALPQFDNECSDLTIDIIEVI